MKEVVDLSVVNLLISRFKLIRPSRMSEAHLKCHRPRIKAR